MSFSISGFDSWPCRPPSPVALAAFCASLYVLSQRTEHTDKDSLVAELWRLTGFAPMARVMHQV